MSEKPTSRNTDGVFEPFRVESVPWEEFARGERFGMRLRHLSSYGGGTQISVSMEVLAPSRQANQAHFHMLEEEHVYILEGSLSLQLGARTFELSPGHYVCFPAGRKVGHALVNRGTQPCRYLVLGNPQPADVAVFTDTGRVEVRLLGEGYCKPDVSGYWEGVDVDTKA